MIGEPSSLRAMKTETLEYTHEGQTYEGFIAVPDGAGPFPAVLVSHAWAGRDDFADAKAKALAELGYVAFAHDLYGKGKRGTSVEENQALMTPFVEDRGMLQARMAAAIDLLKGRDEVDASKVAAIGFCFGGLCVLDLVRSGADVAGVVSFHGLLMPSTVPNKIRDGARALVLHGHDDPMVPPDMVLAFEKEMSEGKADWQLHAYGNTKHAFTVPEANDHDFGTVYNRNAERRSWASMKSFLEECFG